MAQLAARDRKLLPDSDFAYVDSQGRRRLPIHDEAHIRNALARFSRTAFETENARERARTRLLKAAKKHGIVPVGFVTGQLNSLSAENARLQRQVRDGKGAGATPPALPTGFVTFLFSDMENSTGLVGRLGDGYTPVLNELRALQREPVRQFGGHEVDVRADELFAVFDQAAAALEAAIAIQRAVTEHRWPGRAAVRLRIGIHSGRPTLTDDGYVGLDVHTAARVCTAAHGGQILLSAAAHGAIADPGGVTFRSLGQHHLRGLPQPEALFQADVPDLPSAFPPPRLLAAAAADLG